MRKLSVHIEFDSEQEMIEYFSEGKEPQEIVATKTKAKGKVKADADVLAKVELPKEDATPTIFPAEVTTITPTVSQVAPQALPFDRNIVLSNISSTVNDLKVAQVPDATVAKLFGNIYAKLGIAVTKASNLDDVTLANFNSVFYPEVQLLRDSLATVAVPNASANSFI